MYTNPFFNVGSAQLSVLPVVIVKVDGYFRGSTADAWLQIWDTAQAPTNLETNSTNIGQTLLKEWPIPQSAPFYFEFKDNNLLTSNGAFITVSTTEGTYTAGGDTMDLSVETEGPAFGTDAANVAGNLTSGVTQLAVFTNGAGGAGQGPGKLFRIDYSDDTGGNYVMVFANAISPGDTPLWTSLATAGSPALLHAVFGDTGLIPFSQGQTALRTDFSQAGYNGCYIGFSSSPVSYVGTGLGNQTIQAVYALI